MWHNNFGSLILASAIAIATGGVFAHVQDTAVPSPSVPGCDDNLSVRLFAKQAVFKIGQPVPVRLEMQNCGQKDLWVAFSYEENLGFPANLLLIVRDQHRRRVLPNSSIFVGGLGKPPYEWWIRLPPGYLYGRDVLLTQYYSAFVTTPGKYQINVSYTGIPREQPQGGRHPRDSTTIPPDGADVFVGRTESNSVQIEVLAKSAP